MHILIADDDRNFGFVMKTELEREAHTVDLVHDGIEAVMHFLRSGYDFILLDASMPHLDGMDALKIIKQIKPDIGAVLFSGNMTAIDPEARNSLVGQGAFFFQKPFDIQLLKNIIQGGKP